MYAFSPPTAPSPLASLSRPATELERSLFGVEGATSAAALAFLLRAVFDSPVMGGFAVAVAAIVVYLLDEKLEFKSCSSLGLSLTILEAMWWVQVRTCLLW